MHGLSLKFSLTTSQQLCLYTGLPFYTNLTILASFFSNLITESTLNDQVSLPYTITLSTQVQYDLPFAPKSKPLLVNKHLTPSIPYSC